MKQSLKIFLWITSKNHNVCQVSLPTLHNIRYQHPNEDESATVLMLVITSLSLSQLTGGCHPAEQFDWLQFQNRQHQKSAMKKRREEEVTDCDRILRTSEKKMMRSRREREREGESRVSLDDTAAADSREREPLWELLRMEWDGERERARWS